EAALSIVERAENLVHDVLFRGDDYVRWYRAAEGDETAAPRFDDLVKLFEEVREFAPRLDDPQTLDLQRADEFWQRAKRLRERIELPLAPDSIDVLTSQSKLTAVDRRRLTALLSTDLLSPALRGRVEK